jgi:3D-(3,5/4)-trihydroxycyclohexane-1,2-dione acylhydrolase (decyclizing)
VIECQTHADFLAALETARTFERTTVISIRNDRYESVPGYESWWDVPIAEVSTMPDVQAARKDWEQLQKQERLFLSQDANS